MRTAIMLLLGALLAGSTIEAAALSAEPSALDSHDPRVAAFEKAVAGAKAAMMANPEHALAKSRVALARAADLPPSRDATIARATAQWLVAEAFIGVNRPDAASTIVADALQTVERIAPRSKLHGDLLRSRGAIAAIAGHVQQALGDFQKAFEVFRSAGEIRSQAISLQDIGQIYWDAGDYPRVLQYYSQAGELYKDDPAFTLTSHNNRAEVLRKLGRPSDAVTEYHAALKSAGELKSPLLEVRILSNLAAAEVEAGNNRAAERAVANALQMSQAGEAAGWKPFVLGAAAKLAAARGDFPRAAALLERTFAGTKLATTQMQFKEFHEVASSVYARLGKNALAFDHLRAFHRLDSEARNLTASTSSQLMTARFDFANQNLKISQLKQGQLTRDIQLEKQKSQFRTVLLSGLIVAGAVVFALLLLGFLSIRRSRNEVRGANAVLTVVNAKLEKALKAKTEFLATTSHEIRTPLNGILGMTQILLANRKIEGEVREQVEVVHGAGETMRALVDDILDVAKMETGEVSVVLETVSLKQILADAARLWGGQALGKGLALEVEIDGAPEHILSDSTRVRQIVFNLLSNAIKFTHHGHVGLKVYVERRTSGEELVVEISDTGLGIPEEDQERIFEAFHQVDGGTTRQFSGTGLGLAICRNLADALGGSIAVLSRVGAGSTFTLRLPFERAEHLETLAHERSTARPGALSEASVVLVESNGLTQGAIRSLLEPVVGSVDCVANSRAALLALRTWRVDHLLIEARSAEIDGLNPIESLRALVDEAGTFGVLTTILCAPSEELPLTELLQVGASQVVMKPVSGTRLVAVLAEAYPPIERPADDRAAPIASAA